MKYLSRNHRYYPGDEFEEADAWIMVPYEDFVEAYNKLNPSWEKRLVNWAVYFIILSSIIYLGAHVIGYIIYKT